MEDILLSAFTALLQLEILGVNLNILVSCMILVKLAGPNFTSLLLLTTLVPHL